MVWLSNGTSSENALEDIKAYLTKLLVLASLIKGIPLILTITALDQSLRGVVGY